VVGDDGDDELVDDASDVAARASIRMKRSSRSASLPAGKRVPVAVVEL
jgi:hypothetical protein